MCKYVTIARERKRAFLIRGNQSFGSLPTENALASEANASNSTHTSTVRTSFFTIVTRCSHRAITTLINNRITRFTENGLLRNKMRVRRASLSFAAGHRVNYYTPCASSNENSQIPRSQTSRVSLSTSPFYQFPRISLSAQCADLKTLFAMAKENCNLKFDRI